MSKIEERLNRHFEQRRAEYIAKGGYVAPCLCIFDTCEYCEGEQ